jgi:hypothetical protein
MTLLSTNTKWSVRGRWPPTLVSDHDATSPDRSGDVHALSDQQVRAVPNGRLERERGLVRSPAALLPDLEYDDPHATGDRCGHLIPGPQRLLGTDADDERRDLDLRTLEPAREQRSRRLPRGSATGDASSRDGAGIERAAEAEAAAAASEEEGGVAEATAGSGRAR